MTPAEINQQRETLRDLINASVILGADLLETFHALGNKFIIEVSITEYVDKLGDWALEFVTKYPYNPDLDSTEQLYAHFDADCWDVAVSTYGLEKVREEFEKHDINFFAERTKWEEAGKPWN